MSEQDIRIKFQKILEDHTPLKTIKAYPHFYVVPDEMYEEFLGQAPHSEFERIQYSNVPVYRHGEVVIIKGEK